MSDSHEFKPKPYSFALVDIYKKPLVLNRNILAICPPIYILLDHTIAVIWKLFSLNDNDPVSLGSAQISWALRFLEGVTTDARVQCGSLDTKKAIECLHSAFVNCISQETLLVDEEGTESSNSEQNGGSIN